MKSQVEWSRAVEFFEFPFDCFESRSNASSLHSKSENLCRMVRNCIRLLRILFECFQFTFEWLESLPNGLNCIRLLQISFQCFQYSFEWLESLSKGSNLHLIDSNLVRMRICIQMVRFPVEFSNLHSNLVQILPISLRIVRIRVEWFEFSFICFESRSNDSNLRWNS